MPKVTKPTGPDVIDVFNDKPRAWMVGFFHARDPSARRYHLFEHGSEMSACHNYKRPVMAFKAGEGDTPCARCIEAFTMAGKPAPEFP